MPNIFAELPLEILELLIFRIDIPSRYRLKQTCKQLFFFLENGKFWKSYFISIFEDFSNVHTHLIWNKSYKDNLHNELQNCGGIQQQFKKLFKDELICSCFHISDLYF